MKMNKILISLAIITTVGFSNSYYSKVEPINNYEIKSSVSGKVVLTNNQLESSYVKDDTIIKIDSYINEIELRNSQKKLEILRNIRDIEEDTLRSFNKVSSKSKFDKDLQKIKILNIKSNITDLETKIETLKDTINKKNLIENNKYIYDISVKVGDFVNPGTLLYTAIDISSAKLTIFISKDNIKDIKNKKIYLDDKETDFKVSKLYKIADKKHISSYKCEINIPAPDVFSKLMKIEFK
ncbi:MAG: hypothetical protein U9Q30_02950 [Campylobacterota bacterium]|nr:hypothetical protein [Campylobacterota bacterium]